MQRHEYLRAFLKGEPLPDDLRCREWAQVHKPLLSPSTFSLSGRRLNNFCVGSDPEFVFVNRDTNHKVNAIDARLHVGVAAGCDQNERLVELRPWPSTSVVAHVAGILTALRWLYRVHGRNTAFYIWRAGAFFGGDGIGGHIHFGRKRPTRPVEVAALDGLARAFRASGFFPVTEWNQRIRGDNIGQHYGAPGDFRVQAHGYEYRSLPSWLQSPSAAFIALAASKLAVLAPDITTTWSQPQSIKTARERLRGLAKLYKGLDDDAYLLYHLLTRDADKAFENAWGTHFAPNWGLPEEVPETTEERSFILPASIKPEEAEIREILEHLLFSTPLNFVKYPPSFRTAIPDEYIWLPRHVVTNRRAGFGDLLHNLVQSTQLSLIWDYTHQGPLRIAGHIPACWSRYEANLLRSYEPTVSIEPSGGKESVLVIPKGLCQTGVIAGFRAVLLYSGLFPLWTVDTVEADSYGKWAAAHEIKKKPETWRRL